MAQHVCITGIGDDRPGIVSGVTAVLLRFEANLVESTMTMLGNQFAFLMVVDLPADVNLDHFTSAFNPVEKQLRFSIFVQPLANDIHADLSLRPAGEPYMVTVAGNDRTGITASFTDILSRHGINIMDLNAKTIDGSNGPAYVLMMECIIPPSVDTEQLEADLTAMGQKMGVEVTYHPIENVPL